MIGLLGIISILALAYLLSNNRNKINLKLVLSGLSLQVFFAVLILKVPGGKWVFQAVDKVIKDPRLLRLFYIPSDLWPALRKSWGLAYD